MLGRMLGAARLNAGTFEDVEHDRGATLQALAVVIIVAIATGIGGLLRSETDILQGLGFGVVRGVLFWALWALGTWVVGSTILRTSATNADWGQTGPGHRVCANPGDFKYLHLLAGGRGSLRFRSAPLAIGGYDGCCTAESRLQLHMESILRGSHRGHSRGHRLWDYHCASGYRGSGHTRRQLASSARSPSS